MNYSDFPYYILPAVDALPDASGEERVNLVRRIAAAVGDPVALRTLIGVDPEEFLSFYPDMTSPELSTEDTIDTFLDHFGKAPANTSSATASASTSSSDDELENLIQPVAIPYDLSSLEALPELPGTSDLFEPAESSEQTEVTEFTESTEPSGLSRKSHDTRLPHETQDSPLSESLARIMIKNGNYQKALEIITEISLNNPKKSIYFADQIRFLKKLIAIKAISSEN